MTNSAQAKFTPPNNFVQKMANILQSKFAMPIILLFGFLFWSVSLPDVVLFAYTIYIALTFVFCEDVKNIYCTIFFVQFYLTSFKGNALLIKFIICISILLASIIFFMIKHRKVQTKKGKMFIPFLLLVMAVIFGGIFSNFQPLTTLAVVGIAVVVYLLYYIALNFTKDLKTFFAKMFAFGSILISLQILIAFCRAGNFFDVVVNRGVINIGVQNINVIALYLTIGMVAFLFLGLNKKLDFLYILPALIIFAFTIFTFCRMMVLISAIAFISFIVFCFIKSTNKKYYLILFGISLVIVLSILFVLKDEIYNVVNSLISRGIAGNGRESLWSWCFNKFKSNWAFGIGFYVDGIIPGLDQGYVEAHNTVLQWLTSVGIFGTLLIIPFYYFKYRTLIKSFKVTNLFIIISLLIIAASGITDQAASVDVFIFLFVLLSLSCLENTTAEINNENNKETKSSIEINSNKQIKNKIDKSSNKQIKNNKETQIKNNKETQSKKQTNEQPVNN